MNPIHDVVIDQVVRLRAIRTGGAAAQQVSAIVEALAGVRDRVRRLGPPDRRLPRLAEACDWFHRTLAEAEVLTDDQRAELGRLVAEVKSLVGADVPR